MNPQTTLKTDEEVRKECKRAFPLTNDGAARARDSVVEWIIESNKKEI